MLSLEAIHLADSARLEILLKPAGYFRQKTRRLQELSDFVMATYGEKDSVKRGGQNSVDGETGDAARLLKAPIVDERGARTDFVSVRIENTYTAEHAAIGRMFAEPTDKLREILLKQNGVGPETADSILLYGGNHAVFVVDAYSRRIFQRHQLVMPGTDYETIRLLVERSLRSVPPEARGIIPCDIIQGDIQGDPATTGDRPGIHDPSAISITYRPALVQRYNEFHALLVQLGKHYCLKKAPKCTNCPLSCLLPTSDNE